MVDMGRLKFFVYGARPNSRSFIGGAPEPVTILWRLVIAQCEPLDIEVIDRQSGLF
jgi:hypothetical protein